MTDKKSNQKMLDEIILMLDGHLANTTDLQREISVILQKNNTSLPAGVTVLLALAASNAKLVIGYSEFMAMCSILYDQVILAPVNKENKHDDINTN